jgi:hypothetical protein
MVKIRVICRHFFRYALGGRFFMRYVFLFILLTIAACSNANITVTASKEIEPTRQELRKAMRHHGVLFAQQDDKGEWYFVRNGKRCRLFSRVEIGRM